MASDIDQLKGFNPAPNSGGGLFLKLSDGDSVRVRLASLPVIFQNTFNDPVQGDKVDTRFAFIVYNHDLEKAQIWVTNGATYGQQIAPLLEDDEYGDWREYDVKIARTGEKAQTRYNIRPGTKRTPLTDEQIAMVDAVDIIAKIDNGKGASHVMWLVDYREQEEQAKASPRASKQATGNIKDDGELDIVENDIPDEVNLDDIPF